MKTIARNENQIRTILEGYLGRHESALVAKEIVNAIDGESRHTHEGETFFVHRDMRGELTLTMESSIESSVKRILEMNLEEDKVEECFEQIITEISNEVETIWVEASSSHIYDMTLAHVPCDDSEERFARHLREAVESKIPGFGVPVYDPSIDEDENIHFVSSAEPGVGYSYDELQEIAQKNGVKLGSKNQYVLFLATIIYNLVVNEGWDEKEAWRSVVSDSGELGIYYDDFAGETSCLMATGSKKVAGKCDLANTYKILSDDDTDGVLWIAGGSHECYSDGGPLASLNLFTIEDFDDGDAFSVGWFVIQ